jgi:hypothetical protein
VQLANPVYSERGEETGQNDAHICRRGPNSG